MTTEMSKNDVEHLIYKVKQLENNTVKAIYVFYGLPAEEKESKYVSSEYKTMPAPFRNVFSDQEWTEIQKYKPTLFFMHQRIYLDDSIAVIKIKIINALAQYATTTHVSMEELYLFTQKKEKLNSAAIYQSLTQHKKIALTKLRLYQFLQNIMTTEGFTKLTIPDKPIYTYDDIFEMGLDNHEYILNKPLGQKYYIVENEYPYICNPFDIQTKEYDRFLERNSNKSLSTLNNHLLLNSGTMVHNTLFLCLAKDVLRHAESIQFPAQYMLQIYYPFLYNKHIFSLEDLNEETDKLVANNKKFNNANAQKTFDIIDMFYDIYFSRNKELNYQSKGIRFMKVVIRPEADVKFPLEVLFKIIHATAANPLIKYNPSIKQENIYRLYADKTSMDGRKIPYLKKASIFKLMKTIGKTKSVTVYIETDEVKMMTCEFDEYGYITITAEFSHTLDVSQVNSLFRTWVNPILQEVKTVMEQSGYSIQLFHELDHSHVDIKLITYETNVKIQKVFDIRPYHGCISTVFINETEKSNENMVLRFKRVSNFSKFASQEAFVLEKAQQGLRGSEIIQELIANFPEDTTLEQAEELVRKIANELEVERGVRKTDIRIKENPGFKTTLALDPETATLQIVTENINHLRYLDTLPIYLDTLIRLTQDKTLSNHPGIKICGAPSWAEVSFPEFTSSAESSAKDAKEEAVSIEDEDEDQSPEIETTEEIQKPKAKGAFDLFFDDDDDEEEEEEEDEEKSSFQTGGEKSDIEEEDEVKNIDGMKLNKPYYFQTLIEKRDPVLILKEDTKEYNSYSRTCLSDKRRQPVILTDAQLEKINREHPGFLREQDVIRYGSDVKHQHNYICPRYWCLKNNTVIPPDEIKEEIGPNGKKEFVHRPKTGPSCGKVLPKKEKEVKPGYYVYEFHDEKEKAFPGLIPDKHPNGLCLPCCFKNYNTDGRIKAKQKCMAPPSKTSNAKNKPVNNDSKASDDSKAPDDSKILEDSKAPEDSNDAHVSKRVQPLKQSIEIQDNASEDTYVLGPDKFPLEPGRWGYLPPEMQTMLREINANCQTSKTNTSLKKNHPCLLRHGVEIHKKQSFIACISDALFFAKSKILSIPETKEWILDAITIDDFIKYQNGNLVETFQEKDRDSNLEVEKYENSLLYKKLNLHQREEIMYFSKVVSAFENFKDFMRDPESLIDHTYLWDILSAPNKKLFPQGVNLVIFQLPHNDITNNVQLICPSNHYSTYYFQSKKPTILLLKEEEYYEPIYSLEIKARVQKDVPLENIRLISKNKDIKNKGIVEGSRVKTKGHPSQPGYSLPGKVVKLNKAANTADIVHDPYKESIIKEFKEIDPHLSKQLRTVFKELIKPFFETICRPLESMPNVYKAKRPLSLSHLLEKLDTYEYETKQLVMNFNNKIIGVVAQEPNGQRHHGFVPCYPSAYDDTIKPNAELVFMNNEHLWNDYFHTIQFLNKLYNRSAKRKNQADIPCKPAFKIIEDEHVVGILTETDQFIQISEPILPEKINKELDLPSIHDSDYLIQKKPADVYITTENTTDVDREDYIKKIKLETNFYNVFRNSIRILLNKYENHVLREKIETAIQNHKMTYTEKLEHVKELLHDLVGEKIQFTGDSQFYKLIHEVSTCLVQDTQQCNKSPLCVTTEQNKCNMILPIHNLISGKKNEELYYGKMADELVRYNRIKSFMFEPQMYLSFGNIGYNLRDNEIILIQSLLTQEYFDQLIPAVQNKYVKFNTYDETQPIFSQPYDNTVTQLSQVEIDHLVCTKTQHTHIQSSYWKAVFPKNFTELKYDSTVFCTYALIIDLIEEKTKQKYTMNEIKNQLYDEYKKYILQYKQKIIDILISEGKKTLGDQVKSETVSFSNMIYSDQYYLTVFDYWLLVTKYEIPTVFISQKPLNINAHVQLQKNNFVAFVDPSTPDMFYFIMVPSLRPQIIPSFKLVQTSAGESRIRMDQLQVDHLYESMRNTFTIERYLEKAVIAKKQYKKTKKLIIHDEEEEEPTALPSVPPTTATKKARTSANKRAHTQKKTTT